MKCRLIFCLALLGLSAVSYADSTQQIVGHMQSQIQNVQNQIPKQLSKQAAVTKKEIQALRVQLEAEIKNLQKQVQQVQSNSDAKFAKLQKAQASS